MADPTDPVTEADLCAYVDGELDIRRKMEVADYLSHNPSAAAAVMADLHIRDAMRLAEIADRPPRSDVVASARQLDRRISRARIGQILPRASMAAMIALCAYLAQDEISEFLAAAVPSFVDEAIDTHMAARLRETMPATIKDPVLDRAAIRRAMKITFPTPSQDWRILDNRVVPSDDGPGLEISLDAGSGKPVTFFAVPTRDEAPSTPEVIQVNGASVAYWRAGDTGYALAGDLDLHELNRLAEDLADNPIG